MPDHKARLSTFWPDFLLRRNVPMEPWFGNRCIGIDCGSGYPEDSPEGRLACLRLDDGMVFYSEEKRNDH